MSMFIVYTCIIPIIDRRMSAHKTFTIPRTNAVCSRTVCSQACTYSTVPGTVQTSERRRTEYTGVDLIPLKTWTQSKKSAVRLWAPRPYNQHRRGRLSTAVTGSPSRSCSGPPSLSRWPWRPCPSTRRPQTGSPPAHPTTPTPRSWGVWLGTVCSRGDILPRLRKETGGGKGGGQGTAKMRMVKRGGVQGGGECRVNKNQHQV